MLGNSASTNQSTPQVDSEAEGAEAGAGHMRSSSAAIHRSVLIEDGSAHHRRADRLLIRLDEHSNMADRPAMR
jgi:hypothetical protein